MPLLQAQFIQPNVGDHTLGIDLSILGQLIPTIRSTVSAEIPKRRATSSAVLPISERSNLFSYRTTSPAELYASIDPVGSANDYWLRRLHEESSLTVAAWGNHGRLLSRNTIVTSKLVGLHILGLTILGEPRHPLYVRSGVMPRPWHAGIA